MLKPGIYPQATHRPTTSRGEEAVHGALKRQLPEGWYAWHSLKIRTRKYVLGEGDFVIGVPGRGLIVIEVKGGIIKVLDGQWLQNGQPMNKAPLDQARNYVGKLLCRCKEARVEVGVIDTVACFPETHFCLPPSQDDLREHVIGAEDMPYLAEWLQAFAKSYLAKEVDQPPGWLEVIHGWWGAQWVPAVCMGRQKEIDQEKRLELDTRQLAFFDRFLVNDRLRVVGPAGSGKTLLALECARREAADGREVLLLCFTDALAHWLAESLADTAVRVNTVRRHAASLLLGQEENKLAPEGTGFWAKASLEALATLGGEPAHDTIIIDEAQDFEEQDWLLVDAMGLNKRRAFVFHDPLQAFWPERELHPDVMAYPQYPLGTAYRCPPGIWDLALLYAGQEGDERKIRQAVKDKRLGLIVYRDQGGLERELGREIQRLRGELIKPGDIALISLAGQKSCKFIKRESVGDLPVVAANDDRAGECMIADTFLRFKGLERPVVVIGDLDQVSPTRLGVRMHIALTRATQAVRIMVTQARMDEDALFLSSVCDVR